MNYVRLRKLVAYLKEKKVTAVAMEATGIYWIPVFEMLKNEGFDTCLVNARNIKDTMYRWQAIVGVEKNSFVE